MIGRTLSHYQILEKLGKLDPHRQGSRQRPVSVARRWPPEP
jgi:hypothetical protein